MKIVIDIPEDVYRRLKAGDTNAGNTFHNTALEAIGNGTPLPKGCGDLIDRDELRNVCATNQVDIVNDGNKNALIALIAVDIE